MSIVLLGWVLHLAPVVIDVNMRTDSSQYFLNIKNGSTWRFIASPSAEHWLSKFAFMLRLPVSSATKSHLKESCFLNCNQRENRLIEQQIFFNSASSNNIKPIKNIRDYHYIRLWAKPLADLVFCGIYTNNDEKRAVLAMRYAVQPIQIGAISSGGFPFHSALLEWNGLGIIIAGHSGSGKSTCCRRIPPSWGALCDDETLIIRDNSGDYHCHPFPTWSDYLENRAENTWNVQHSAPLKAIFFLEQSDIDHAFPLSRGIAATRMFESASQIFMRYWIHGTLEENRREKRLVFENACEMAQKIPAYTLRATLHGRFWEEMERVIDEL